MRGNQGTLLARPRGNPAPDTGFPVAPLQLIPKLRAAFIGRARWLTSPADVDSVPARFHLRNLDYRRLWNALFVDRPLAFVHNQPAGLRRIGNGAAQIFGP